MTLKLYLQLFQTFTKKITWISRKFVFKEWMVVIQCLANRMASVLTFKISSPFSVYVHCRNHRLALCFAHIIPRYPNMVKFDSLLLNLSLVLKNSNNKTNAFMEVQEVYGLPKLKLIKAVYTRWLSQGKATDALIVTSRFLFLWKRFLRRKKNHLLGKFFYFFFSNLHVTLIFIQLQKNNLN